jgi:GNAT superfamily N-acetyltransferase
VNPPVELKPLDVDKGAKFIFSTWKYAHETTLEYIQKTVQLNKSSGVYVSGEPVSGITTSSAGLMAKLYTLKEHRNKNYGKLCMQDLMKQLAGSGLIPASTVEVNNEPSKKFHEKVGLKVFQYVDFVCYDA